jgi:hypothetical protein
MCVHMYVGGEESVSPITVHHRRAQEELTPDLIYPYPLAT